MREIRKKRTQNEKAPRKSNPQGDPGAEDTELVRNANATPVILDEKK